MGPQSVREVREGQPISARNHNNLITGVQGVYVAGGENVIIDGSGVHVRQIPKAAFSTVWPDTLNASVIFEDAGGSQNITLARAARDTWHTTEMLNNSNTVVLTLPADAVNGDLFFFAKNVRPLVAGNLLVKPNTGQVIQSRAGDVSDSQTLQVGSSIVLRYSNNKWYPMWEWGLTVIA